MRQLAGPFVLAVVALMMTATPGAALAQVQTYYHAGAWDAFSGRGGGGEAVCGVGTTNPSDGRRFALRFDIGGSATTLSAIKPDWSVPDNTHVTVVMQVGLNTPWTLQGVGHDHSIDWTLDPAAMQTFDRQFRGASSMTLTFPDGNEPPWSLSLAGSSAISDTFGRCIRDLTRQVQSAPPPPAGAQPSQGPTQPFNGQGAAQPESSAPPPAR
jgi:hypothetical protein